ncbi:3-methyl-2-oxobutanoate hydroxymethyltransferase [Candidatus Berkiella cookevillensis]|uniref:3-methyl-2-oxobutanoate hydroxymethyltransferase n=1 Tax=Candidatus Berkiella cookevillensis TaxID=437022 RepID=A0A0Q9YH79_9GAMM|nr:3-methyl-2-oxobutanoate hydroxymethyltransferase [Candidatus Berkiella cookevillensis]MCS5708500.1 3-methyl-2-oxobutanoate hydroxymethyltransferase [Candidatus Berkiella cookevillensis]
MKITELKNAKLRNNKITMVTCYDFWSAKIIANTQVDMILVGDSLAMVMHGYTTTVPTTVELMCLHVQAVAKGAPHKLIVGDMPFLSYRKSLDQTMLAVERLMQSGSHAVKLEGGLGNEEAIKHIVQSGVSVIGHIGLTPQSIHQLGGHKVQGSEDAKANTLLTEAKILEDAGCCALVLECVPENLADRITQELSIPTIGIGAGNKVDGQVLVLQDLLGMDPEFQPKFLRKYLNGFDLLKEAIDQYSAEVKSGAFPSAQHSY